MANVFETEDRRVVPNWRSFGKTIAIGELDSLNLSGMCPTDQFSIDEYLSDFAKHKTVPFAADLIGAALVNNKTEEGGVLDAAKFILDSHTKATSSQIALSERILGISSIKNNSPFTALTLDEFNPKIYQNKIHETKTLLRAFPANPILLVELSRYYSVLGEEKNSIQAMKMAMQLAKENRFVLRSATRLFAHYNSEQNDYLGYIQRILSKSRATSFDPWLISAEISISSLMDRSSKFIKKGLELIDSGNISPFNYTELASSIATLEMQNGNMKKSRNLFRKALLSPNDNSLAQLEWASAKDSQLHVVQDNFDIKTKFEAFALDNYYAGNYQEALESTMLWFTDQPFSKRSVVFGSNLASTILKDQNSSIALLHAGLVSHPNDPTLLNNLAYAYALDNRTHEAAEQLRKLPSKGLDKTTEICAKATEGLVAFRQGHLDKGRALYMEAIKNSYESQNKNLNWIAILNYAREEILQETDYVDSIKEIVYEIPDKTPYIDTNVLKKDIVDMLSNYKKKRDTQ